MKYLKFAVAAVACAQPMFACDFCSIYSATQAKTGKGFYAGVAEQFTHFGTLQADGKKVSNEADQWLDSSISQVLAGYNFNSRFGAQLNVPIIHRSFNRPEGFATDRGTESGLGDVSLIGRFYAYRKLTEENTYTWDIFAGIKVPTGSTRRIKEEFNETEVPGAPESGIHGHDLTLGSGSYDGLFGTSFYARHHRLFFGANAQYSLRSEGDYGYRFADDLTWSGGPGALLLMNERFTVSLQANVSGENKARDTFQGERAEDTGITSVYLGPEFNVTWRENLNAELGVDIPMNIDNTALQIVPDYRIHGGLTWHF
jgi:hypothetical protein